MNTVAESVLGNAKAVDFARQCLEEYQSHQEFEAIALAVGMDPQQAWALACFVRKAASYDHLTGGQENGSVPAYFRLTRLTQDRLVRLHEKASLSSTASLDARRYHTSPRLQALVVSDLCAGMERDGVIVAPESVWAVLNGDQAVRGSAAVLRNALRVANRASLAHAAFEPEGLSPLFEEGAGADVTNGRTPLPNLQRPYVAGGATFYLDGIREGFAGKGPCVTYPEINILLASETLWEMRPFSRWNGLHEAVLRHLAMRAIGLPLLSFVPLSRLRLEWERGQVGAAEGAPYPYGEAMFETAFGIDCTLCFQQEVALLEHGLGRVQDALATCREKEAQHMERANGDARLGDRQRAELRRLMGGANTTDAATYMQVHRVVSSTAHLDLAKLEEYGYLAGAQQGKKRVFSLSAQMAV